MLTRFRDAITGLFVPKAEALKRPDTTVEMRINNSKYVLRNALIRSQNAAHQHQRAQLLEDAIIRVLNSKELD